MFKRMPAEYFFILVAGVFGMIHLVLLPPFQSPDESNHFHRSLHISNGHLMGETLDGNRLGGVLNLRYWHVTNYYDHVRKHQIPTDDFNQKFVSDPTFEEKGFVDFANVGYYAPTVYVPQTIGIAIGKVCTSDPLTLMYVGRIMSLLFWAAIVFFAIRIIPSAKEILLFVALLPASLSINSSLSGDVFSNALSFLFIAMVFHLRKKKEKINTKTLMLITMVILTITINKLVYSPMILLLIIVPNRIISIVQKGALMLSVVLVAVLWALYAGNIFIPFDSYHETYRAAQQLNPGVNPAEQLQYILSHPFDFIKTAFLSYIESAPATWAHYIGKFGWEKNYIPTWCIALLSFVLVQLIFQNRRTNVEPKIKWTPMLLSIFLMILAFTISIYMQWSPVGNERVWSLSGRYFIPIFPLVFIGLFLFPKRICIPTNYWHRTILILSNSVLLLSIYSRYYT